MSFEPGLYLIRSLSPEARPFVGRSHIEDASLLPKPILVLYDQTQPPPPFLFQQAGEKTFWVKTLNDPVVDIDNKLFAVSRHEFQLEPPEWEVLPASKFGPHAYVVKKSGEEKSWTAPSPNEGTEQIRVEGMIVLAEEAGGIPYSPDQVFVFERILV